MIIKIKKEIGQAVGVTKWKAYGIPKERWDWHNDTVDLDLARLSKPQLQDLAALLTPHQETQRGIVVLLRDIAKWRAAVERNLAALFRQ